MPKTGRFTLEERMAVLELIKPRVGIVDAFLSDAMASDDKKEAWETITAEFKKNRPDRKELTSKEIRELWRRMKHRARMEVRQSIQNAKVGHVRTVPDTDSMGWLPDSNTGHKVIDINDLGLELDTKFITDFVPLLEEEATVLETRNGILHDYKEKSSKRRASNPLPSNEILKVVRTDFATTPANVIKEVSDDDVVEVLDASTPVTVVKVELDDTSSPSSRESAPSFLSKEDESAGILSTSLVNQQSHFTTANINMNIPTHFDQRKATLNPTMTSNTNSRMASNANSTMSSNENLTMNTVVNSVMNRRTSSCATTTMTTAKDSTCKDFTELSIQFLKQEHEAKMELIRLKQAAAKAKSETARAKRSAYDEKRMFYFEKRKHLHDHGV